MNHSQEPIAICGIACRFPGKANSPAEFWSLLCNGLDAITKVPADRWHASLFYHSDAAKPGRTYSQWGGFIDNVRHFDAQFFGISPREAAKADPQQRLLLELAYEALQDCGSVPAQIAGSNGGVFIGISTYDYGGMQSSPFDRTGIDAYTNIGSALCVAANRISYFFDLHGPSIAVDTACSSSLVAVHLACRSIWNQQCSLAFVGGVNLILRPEGTIGFSKASMLAPDGRCKSFDARANGYVRAEGAGLLLLKPLSRAISDGDSIYAVICASAVNQDGRTGGISVPNGQAQEAMLQTALTEAGIGPEQVQYVEAHGTGTPVGDPIEATAIGNVFGKTRRDESECLLGSIKTNIGHAEAAAGIAGLIKTALCLKYGQIPATLHFETPNARIPFSELRLRVVQRLETWPDTNGEPRRAGVNSFGFGGTNAHVILASAPQTNLSVFESSNGTQGDRLLTLSGRTREASRASARSYADFLEQTDATLDDIARSAAVNREHHPYRLAALGRSKAEIAQALRDFSEERPNALIIGESRRSVEAPIAFICSGMGQQYAGMGLELLNHEPVYRQTIEQIDSLFLPLAGWSLVAEFRTLGKESRIAEARVAQPAIFAMQVALAALWRSWGVVPSAVLGHSVGEVAAAHIAGSLELVDGVRLIYHRSRLQQRLSGKGGMLAIGLPRSDAEVLIADKQDVAIGAINSSQSVTLTGSVPALERIADDLTRRDVFNRFLKVDVPYHSPLMLQLHDEFVASLSGLCSRSAAIPLFSTVTGGPVDGSELGVGYWWHNIEKPVLFEQAINELIRTGHSPAIFLELAANPVLAASIAECLRATNRRATVIASSLRRGESDRRSILTAAAQLYIEGVQLDWQSLHGNGTTRVKLPLYPWQRDEFWSESETSMRDRLGPVIHPLLGVRAISARPTWKSELDLDSCTYLADHRVQDTVVFPAAGFVEMAVAAARELFGPDGCVLEEVAFLKPMFFPDRNIVDVELSADGAQSRFEILSRCASAAWTLHANGNFRELARSESPKSMDLAAARRVCRKKVEKSDCYRLFGKLGLNYGPMFQGIEHLWIGSGEALADICLPQDLAAGEYLTHPSLLDSCFQTLLGASLDAGLHAALYLPVRIRRLVYWRSPANRVWCRARLSSITGSQLTGDLELFDESGKCVASVQGFVCEKLQQNASPTDGRLYEFRWQLRPLSIPAGFTRESDYLPSTHNLHQSLNRTVRDLYVRLYRERYYKDFMPQSRDLAAAYIVQALASLAAGRAAVAAESATGSAFGVTLEFQRLFSTLVHSLKSEDLIHAKNPNELWRRLWHDFPDAQSELILMRSCGENLADVLQGRADPLALIFSGGSSATLEQFYQDSPTLRLYNLLFQQVIKDVVAALPNGRILKVCEIGGGTGGVTTYMLPHLAPERVQYTFTDVAPLLVSQAQQKFADFPFILYGTLDIENDPIEQGFQAHSYDLVIASHALHATRDLRQTINHVKRLLGSRGLLLLQEGVEPPLSLLLIFGLLRGWWLFNDDLREDGPWVPPQKWQRLLTELGFNDVAVTTDCENPLDSVHSVILARGPSISGAQREPVKTQDEKVWLIITETPTDAAHELARQIEVRGDRAVLAKPEDLDGAAGQFDRWITSISNGKDLQGVVHMYGIGHQLDPGANGESVNTSSVSTCMEKLRVVQALAASNVNLKSGLWLVTRHAQFVPGIDRDINVAQSSSWGVGRVVMAEARRLHCRLVDLSDAFVAEIPALCDELYAEAGEEEIAIRGEARYCHRLVRVTPSTMSTMPASIEAEAFRLEPEAVGVLDSIVARSTPRQIPGEEEIEIEVVAAGLNFKDIMLAMGRLPEGQNGCSLGLECAGHVIRAGSGVHGFAVGDQVIACGRGMLASHITVPASTVLAKPARLSFEEAATIPVAYLTAYYGLRTLAQIARGERVLIHTATGGVGLAAIQLARLAGAEVFATAGSPAKRALLGAIGVRHVMDSRSLDFAREIMEATAGEGIDIVLNTLTGEAIPASLDLLRPYGRFVEIGKRDILENTRLGLRPFEKNLSYFAVDLDRLWAHRPAQARSLYSEVLQLIENSSLKPLSHRSVPLSRLPSALRTMAQAKHVGKMVVSMAQADCLGTPRQNAPPSFRADATYLITGGFGGFGLAVAEWIVNKGARHLVLAGRRGGTTAEAQTAVARLEQMGATVMVRSLDVADSEQVRQLIENISSNLPPLRGVFHAAMVVADTLIHGLSESQMNQVMRPKIAGAWNLHLLCAGLPLDFFVLFSSFASLVGNPGQANYVAANAFLDALAQYRRVRGLPALAVSWGVLAQVGYVAQRPEIANRFAQLLGAHPMPLSDVLSILDELLSRGAVHVGAVDLNWRKTLRALGRDVPQLRDLAGTSDVEMGTATQEISARNILDAAPAARQELLENFLRQRLAIVLRSSSSKIDVKKPLVEFGLDSLMAVEMITDIQSTLGVNLPAMKLMEGGTITSIATFIVDRLSMTYGEPPHPLVAVTAAVDGHKPTTTASIASIASARGPDAA
jgi:acyl transferase domain-containing protein/NADPH:quinone reductase-like Zn-dependent oxidoreductase/acyl carrier protein/ubiquinone/menaquinone biosynthesis C-methylase UbiE